MSIVYPADDSYKNHACIYSPINLIIPDIDVIFAMERFKRNRSDWQFIENEKSVTVGYKNGLVALWNKESFGESNSHVSTRDMAETFYRYQLVTYKGNNPKKPLVNT